jgi:hypothetical protein
MTARAVAPVSRLTSFPGGNERTQTGILHERQLHANLARKIPNDRKSWNPGFENIDFPAGMNVPDGRQQH